MSMLPSGAGRRPPAATRSDIGETFDERAARRAAEAAESADTAAPFVGTATNSIIGSAVHD
jgi:hypothetical protein